MVLSDLSQLLQLRLNVLQCGLQRGTPHWMTGLLGQNPLSFQLQHLASPRLFRAGRPHYIF